MKNLILTSTIIGLISLGTYSFGEANKKTDFGKISPKVKEALTSSSFTGSFIPILVRLSEKADLSRAQLLTSKEEKGQFVYETLTTVAKKSQAPLIKYLESQNISFDRFYISNLIVIKNGSQNLISELSKRSDIEYISSDASFRSVPEPISNRNPSKFLPTSLKGIEQSLKEIGADKVWTELKAKGQGIVIAGQDTGVQWDHPALKSKYRGFVNGKTNHNYNWFDAIKEKIDGGSSCGLDSKFPCDDNGHGTHTVGTMVGSAGDKQIGVAPDAQWIACKNMDNGHGRPSTYIKCFEFFLAPFPMNGDSFVDGRPEKAPHVINNSWGCPKTEKCNGDEMIDVLTSIKQAGIINVVSAGNDGSSCSTIKDQPATHSKLSLTVGAYNSKTGTIARFSSRGPSKFDNEIGPDVAAPGVSINSSIPKNKYSAAFSGTSMAGPHVVGQVALILSANKELIGNVDEVSNIIKETARKKTSSQSCGGTSGTERPNNTYGFGNIDALAAVKKAISLK